jgi:hypothetical protein
MKGGEHSHEQSASPGTSPACLWRRTTVPPITVPGMQWMAASVMGRSGRAVLAAYHWWSRVDTALHPPGEESLTISGADSSKLGQTERQ